MTQVTSAQANKILQAALFTEANRARSFANMMTEAAPKEAQPEGSQNQTSHTAPIVKVTDLQKTAGGLLIAISFIFGINAGGQEGTLAYVLMQTGKAAFGLMVPVLAGYIAYSIADRPGLAPGLIGGFLAVQLQSGFLGGIAAGFLAGYLALNRAYYAPDFAAEELLFLLPGVFYFYVCFII